MNEDIPLKGFGYLPGHYYNRCVDCPEGTHFIAAKRAWRYRPHALEAHKKWIDTEK